MGLLGSWLVYLARRSAAEDDNFDDMDSSNGSLSLSTTHGQNSTITSTGAMQYSTKSILWRVAANRLPTNTTERPQYSRGQFAIVGEDDSSVSEGDADDEFDENSSHSDEVAGHVEGSINNRITIET